MDGEGEDDGAGGGGVQEGGVGEHELDGVLLAEPAFQLGELGARRGASANTSSMEGFSRSRRSNLASWALRRRADEAAGWRQRTLISSYTLAWAGGTTEFSRIIDRIC